ncbi:AFG3 ATPase family protein, putative [Eimeria tenella]|uniref:AFG3 ATPase family protein, putative n=1 Tax=Eimeria tenella TaxID=5802 RepID=U6L2M8_EIMTE|nr:AFG3 ATPase family protein, putative [Eimeria tenella]CDJ42020.1 AFG3 ATPase family protein, putative [Eimeria tenella]|eukprot:XP_013232770.1 AFG3 ATPase family protein, putative [Eimeria tenella]
MQVAAARLLQLQRGSRPFLHLAQGHRAASSLCPTSIPRQFVREPGQSLRIPDFASHGAEATATEATVAGPTTVFKHALTLQQQVLQLPKDRRQFASRTFGFFHGDRQDALGRTACNESNCNSRSRDLLGSPNMSFLAKNGLLRDAACQRGLLQKQELQELLSLLHKTAEGVLQSAAAVPVALMDNMLPPLLRQLHRVAAAVHEEQPTSGTLLQHLLKDLTILSSRNNRTGQSELDKYSCNGTGGRQPEEHAKGETGSSTRKDTDTRSSSSSGSNSGSGGGGDSNKGSRGPGPQAGAGNGMRRTPFGFEAFYPKDASKQQESSSTSNTSGSRSGRLPLIPPAGGALQHLLLRLCVWLGFWLFALSLLSRVVEPQLSLQEFLSSYVARGLVEKVVVVGDRGRCTAVVRAPPTPEQLHLMQQQQQQLMLYMQQQQMQHQMQQYQQQQPYEGQQQSHHQQQYSLQQPQPTLQQQQQPKLADVLSRKQIVRFRTGLTPESFIEKMEHFQASLGIHPKDFLPIYVEEGWNLSLGDLVASAFFFLIMATIARDFLMGGAVNRGGSASGLNRLLGNSSSKRARIKPDTVKVRFADVAGLHEAKREIMEFVSFLKNPAAFQKMGAKLPKGALLVGPPGTGKTLLAKAVAGEAGVPFFSISGSDFVELFVGVGASRVRELFDEARKAAPSIIWIDEIDSVGASRSTQFANSEREQTLNQLLVEMDGFSPHQSVVVLAGTNREDLLDAALKRAGRFDRRVVISRPDVKERAEIFKVHLQPLKLSPRVDATALAERMAALTPGMVGADIANICNEAAIYAARRRTKRGIEQRDFEMAVERIIAGLPSNTKNLMSEKQRRTIALHEAGHAVAGWFLKHADVVLKLTIIPRDSGAMGFSQQMPPPVELYEKDALLDRIAVCLAGRAAEELFMGCVSSGAVDDIEKATHLARLIIMQLGMNPKIGLVNLKRTRPSPQDPYQLYSDATAELVDEEVRNLISGQYERVKALLMEREKEMHALSDLLLEKETLTFADLQDCLGRRPYPPDAQLAAYIDALPTKDSSSEGQRPAAKKTPGSCESDVGPNDGTVDASDGDTSTNITSTRGGHSQQQRQHHQGYSSNRDTEASKEGGKEEAQKTKDKKNKAAHSDRDDDDDDDDDNNGGGGDDDRNGSDTKRGPTRRKLFGGDDDSCLPELLRKNLKPNTPTPSAAAKKTELGHTQ